MDGMGDPLNGPELDEGSEGPIEVCMVYVVTYVRDGKLWDRAGNQVSSRDHERRDASVCLSFLLPSSLRYVALTCTSN